MKVSSIDKALGSVYSIVNLPTSGEGVLKYTTIGRFLFWLNSFFTLKDDGKDFMRFYIGNHGYLERPKPRDITDTQAQGEGEQKVIKIPKLPYENKTPFLTFKEHFCLDLNKFILPKPYNEPDDTNFFIKYASTPVISEMIFNPEGDDILDILINIQYIKNTYEQVIGSNDATSINIYDFVRLILDDMNKEFGLINDFDLHLEEDITYYIVDRKISPNLKDIDQGTLDLVGLGSFAKNINLNSSLNNQLATYAVISAASIKSDVPIENNAMEQWNSNLKDRIVVNRDASSKPEHSDKDLKNKVLALYGYVGFVNRTFQRLPSVSKGSLEASHKAIMSEFVKEEAIRQFENPSGVIPVELSFELKGLSGLKIGQAFKLEKGILPSSYDNRVGFIITRLSDKVQNNEWSTEVTCVMQNLQKATKKASRNNLTLSDILAGDALKDAKTAFLDEIDNILLVEESANIGSVELFNELAKNAEESTSFNDEYTPKWSGFRASFYNEKADNPQEVYNLRFNKSTSFVLNYDDKEDNIFFLKPNIKYLNNNQKRKGLLHPELVKLISRAIGDTNRELLPIYDLYKKYIGSGTAKAIPLTGANIMSGGQISFKTLDKYDTLTDDQRKSVRFGDKRAHDNGWAADIELQYGSAHYPGAIRDFFSGRLGSQIGNKQIEDELIVLRDAHIKLASLKTQKLNDISYRLFVKNFFKLVLEKGYVPKIGTDYGYLHLGVYTKQGIPPGSSLGPTIYSKDGKNYSFDNAPDWAKNIYRNLQKKFPNQVAER